MLECTVSVMFVEATVLYYGAPRCLYMDQFSRLPFSRRLSIMNNAREKPPALLQTTRSHSAESIALYVSKGIRNFTEVPGWKLILHVSSCIHS